MAIICPRGSKPSRTPQQYAELAADLNRAAGHLWQRGNYAAGGGLVSQARKLDPARADLWARREAAIAQAIGRTPAGSTGAVAGAGAQRVPRNALEFQLASTGIDLGGEAMEFWRSWNTAAFKRRDGELSDAELEFGQ